MLPSFLSEEIIQGIKQYLIQGWEPSNENFHGLIRKYCESEGKLYKGPYISIGLPFLKSGEKRDYFESFKTGFIPFLHQVKAWRRLGEGISTIIATGTGSGKTECFLYPMLEYCAKNIERGIKAIVIYPMNALANDQAKRMAKFIYENLKGRIRVGLFIGGYENSASGTDRMEMGSVITRKDTMRDYPPDILLTNYKMLDYMLIRPEDRSLWKNSRVRFLVVDELHTFDGAQGTDLALLIRRLKARLGVDSLVCAGTSATLGAKDDRNALIEYSRDVFNDYFDEDAVVGEERESTDEFLAKSPIEYLLENVKDIEGALKAHSLREGIEKWYRLFFREEPGDVEDMEWRVELGKKLKKQLQFYNLLRSLDGKIKDAATVGEEMSKTLPDGLKPYSGEILNALTGLCSWARNEEFNSLPFVQVRYQIWVRELRRMLCRVTEKKDNIGLISADDRDIENFICLPLIQCTECHTTGWLGRISESDNRIDTDLRRIYNSFFSWHPDTALLFPDICDNHSSAKGMVINICGTCGNTDSGRKRICPSCGSEDTVRVYRMAEIEAKTSKTGANYRIIRKICPLCGSEEKLLLIGARSVTLSSNAISHIWASGLNDDKKLIAFSDSVQDAAHRAGFFGARTYSNIVRMAIAQSVTDTGWNEFLGNISEYWMKRLGEERFISEFIGPNMTDCGDYEDYIRTGKVSDNLIDLVQKRLEWEVFAEFTYASERGRTLERTGIAAMSVNKEVVDNALVYIHDAIGEGFRIGDMNEHEAFVWGILYHFKNRGGVYNYYFKTYMETGGSIYLLNQLPFSPNFGPKSLRPVFLRGTKKRNYEHFGSGWYRTWVRRCFKNYTLPSNIESELYPVVLKILADRSVLLMNRDVYSLNPDNLFLTRNIVMVGNQHGTLGFAVPRIMEGIFLRMPLLEQSGAGHYKRMNEIKHWQKNVYLSGQIRRVIAAEHTGLLERKEREELEKRFNSRDNAKPWYENLLSATPTLEMGIDIGDLSSVLLCQVPPSQANYLQRVGRAGRRDGNSIALTIATGRPHDLYFYAMPEDMFLGRIEPPGVFLNASMVLFRQLIAFCFDRWVSTGISKSDIPDKLRYVLDNVEKSKAGKFPYNFIDFIKKNKQDLFDSFIKFLPGISQRAEGTLKVFLFGTDQNKYFEYYMLERLTSLADERKRFRSLAETLKAEIRRLSGKTQDEYTKKEKEMHENEKDSLLSIIARINNKLTLNFMTDEGLLPNYAFPETGVTLRSVIWRRGGEKKVFEYERAASSAISEFAPENKFYATGHRIEVEQIDMSISKIEDWRFCPSCSHLENIKETGDIFKECPNCGDPQWADIGQIMKLVRLRQVMARAEDRSSRIGDDAEDREPVFYTRHLLPVFKRADIEKAYFMENESMPFGFEFIRNVVLREVNFGKYGDNTRESTRVAGKDAVRPGFSICRECGRVQKSDEVHGFKCKAENGKKDSIVECLYLYREFESEALRIAMPNTKFDMNEKFLQSFIASLQLGLKLKYKGKIDHLKITFYEEKDRKGCQRSYILLYDSVPGGTGYLHDLLSDSLMGVLELARDRMMSCRCTQDAEKDGCYECLFAYRLSHGMELTSRRTAVALLSEILERRNDLKIVRSISDCAVINPLIESELENMFIEALRMLQGAGIIDKFQLEIVSGKPGYFIQAGEYSYLVEPQVELGSREGVHVQCRPDFIIRSLKSMDNILPVAVFLDGYEYQRDNMDDDALKRTGIVKSGNYIVWNLIWDDVNSVTNSRVDALKTSYETQKRVSDNGEISELFTEMADALGVLYLYNKLDLPQMLLLGFYLNNPKKKDWEKAVFLNTANRLSSNEFVNIKDIDISCFEKIVQNMVLKENEYLYKAERNIMSSFLVISKLAFEDRNSEKIYCVNVLDTSGSVDKESWRAYLADINKIQFLKYGFWTTEGLKNSEDYERIIMQFLQEVPVSSEWENIMNEAFDEMKEGLKALRGVPVPVICYEIMEQNMVKGEAELAWPDIQVAVFRKDQRDRAVFMKNGWRVFDSSDKWHEYVNKQYEV